MNRKALAAAYRATAYVVALPDGPCTLRVGAACACLDRWLLANGYRCWSWLTAVNPGSQALAADENAERLVRLRDDIAALGLRALPATASADANDWPDEPSCFVAGLDQERARELARRHGQNAFLAGMPGEAVRLVWVDFAAEKGDK